MAEKSITEKLATHNSILFPVLDELSTVLALVLNEKTDVSKLVPMIENLRGVRQIINNAENIGVIVGVQTWRIGGFPLSGNPQQDENQIVTKVPKNKVN